MPTTTVGRPHLRNPWRAIGQRWRRRRRDVAKEGPALVGGLSGSGAGLAGAAILGPPGALIGPAVSVGARRVMEALRIDRVFDSAAERLAEAHLDKTERERAVTAYTKAIEAITHHIDAGGGLRNDGFFDRPRADDGRTAADEVLENVLRRAREAFELRKAERLGELFAYIARHGDVRPAHAHRLITLAGRLTFRQLLWLGVFAHPEERDLPDWTSSGTLGVRDQGFVLEVLELAQLGMLVRADNQVVTSFAQVNPSLLRTVLDGHVLVEAMTLESVEQEDLDDIVDVLRRLGTVDINEGTTRVEAVVPPGSPSDIHRVKIDQRIVDLSPPPLTREDVDNADAAQGKDEPAD